MAKDAEADFALRQLPNVNAAEMIAASRISTDEAALRQGSDLFENWKDKREGFRLLTASKAQRHGSRIFREHKRRKYRSAGGARSSASTGDFAKVNDADRISAAQPPALPPSYYTPGARRPRGGSASVGGSAYAHASKHYARVSPVIATGAAEKSLSSSPEPSILPAADLIGIFPDSSSSQQSQVDLATTSVAAMLDGLSASIAQRDQGDQHAILFADVHTSVHDADMRRSTTDARAAYHNNKRFNTLDVDDDAEIFFPLQQPQMPPAALPASDFDLNNNYNDEVVNGYASSATTTTSSTQNRKLQQRPTDIDGVASASLEQGHYVGIILPPPPSNNDFVAVSLPQSSFFDTQPPVAPPPSVLQQLEGIRSEIDAQRNSFFASLQQPAQYNEQQNLLVNVAQQTSVDAGGGRFPAEVALLDFSRKEITSKSNDFAPAAGALSSSLAPASVVNDVMYSATNAQNSLPASSPYNEHSANNEQSLESFSTHVNGKTSNAVMTSTTTVPRSFAEPLIYPPVVQRQFQQSELTGTASPLRRLSHFTARASPVAAADGERRQRRLSAAASDDTGEQLNDADKTDAEYFEEDNRRLLLSTPGTVHRRRSSIDSSMLLSKSLSLDAFESLKSEIDGLRSKINQKDHALIDEKRASAAIVQTHRREIAMLKDEIFKSAEQLELTQNSERAELTRKQEEERPASYSVTTFQVAHSAAEKRPDAELYRLGHENLNLKAQLNDMHNDMISKQNTFQTCIDGLNAELSRLQNEIVFSLQQNQKHKHVRSDTETDTDGNASEIDDQQEQRSVTPITSVTADSSRPPATGDEPAVWGDVADENDELNLSTTPVNSPRFTQLDFEALTQQNEALRNALAAAQSTSTANDSDEILELHAELEKLRRQVKLYEDERAVLQQQLIDLQQAELLHEMQDAEQNERIAQLEEEAESSRERHEVNKRESAEKLTAAEQRLTEQQSVFDDSESAHRSKINELTQRSADEQQRLTALQRELNEIRMNEDARKSVAAQWQPSEWYEQSEQVLDAVALAHARREVATNKKALENARSRIILLEGDQEELKKQLVTVQTACDNKIAEMEISHGVAERHAESARVEEVAILQAQPADNSYVEVVNPLENSQSTTDDEVAELKRVLADLKSQNIALQLQLSSAEGEKSALIAVTQQKLGELADEIERLTNELAEKSTTLLSELQDSSGSTDAGNVTQEFELEELRAKLDEVRSERDAHFGRLSALETQLSQAKIAVRQHETHLASMTEHYEHRMHELQQQLMLFSSQQEQQQAELLAASKTPAQHSTSFGDWDISDDEITLPNVAGRMAAADVAEQQAVLMAQLRQDYEKQIAELQQQLAALAHQNELQKRQRTSSSTSSSSTSSPTNTIRPSSARSHVRMMANVMPEVAHANSQTDLEFVAAPLSSISTTTASTQTDAAASEAFGDAEVDSPKNSRPSSANTQMPTPPHIASVIHTSAGLELRQQLEDKSTQLIVAEQKLSTLNESYQASLATLNNEIKRLQKVLVDNYAERQLLDAQEVQKSAEQEQVINDLRRRAEEQRELVQQCERLIADKNTSFGITTRAIDEQISALKVEAEHLRVEKDGMVRTVMQYEGQIEELNRLLQAAKEAASHADTQIDSKRAEVEAELTNRLQADSNERLDALRRELTEQFPIRINQLEASLRRADLHYQQTIQQLESRLAVEQNEAEERLRAVISAKAQQIEGLEALTSDAEATYKVELEQLKAELAAKQKGEAVAAETQNKFDAEVQVELEALMENNDLREELENMRTAFTEQLGELEAALSAKSSAYDEAEGEKRRLAKRLEKLQAEFQQLEQQHGALKDEQTAEIIVLKQQAGNVRTELDAKLQANIDAERQKLQNVEESLRQAQAEANFVNTRLVEVQEKCQNLSTELSDATASMKSRAALCEQLTNELDGATSELASIKIQNDSLLQNEKRKFGIREEQLKSEYETVRADLQAQLKRAQSELARQKSSYNELKQKNPHESVAAAEPGESVALFAVDESTVDSAAHVAALAAAEAAATAAQEEQRKIEGLLEETRHEARRERDRVNQQLRQTQEELVEVNNLYSAEREIVARLERELQQLSVPTPTATAVSSEKLAAAGGGVGGWEHDQFNEDENSSSSSASLSAEFAHQLADVRQQLVEANRLLQEQKQKKQVEPTDDFEETRQKLNTALHAQEQTCARLEQQLQEAEHQIDVQRTMLENLEARLHELDEVNAQLNAEKADYEVQRERLVRCQADNEKEIYTLNQLLNDAGQALSDKQEQQQNVDEHIRQLEDELKAAKLLVITNSREFDQQLDTVVQAEQRAVVDFQRRLDEAATTHRTQADGLERQLQYERDRSETLQRDLLAAQSSRSAEIQAEKSASERKITALEAEIADLRAREAELSAIAAETDAAKRQLSTANARIRELEREQLRTQQQYDELTLHNAHLSELRAMQGTSETELRATAQKLQAERDEARAAAMIVQNSASTAQAEIDRLQRAHAELERQLRDNKQAVEMLQLQQRSPVSPGVSSVPPAAVEQPEKAPGQYNSQQQQEYEKKLSQLVHARNEAVEQLRFANSARQAAEQRLRDARQQQQRLQDEIVRLQTQLDQVKTNKIEVLYTNKALENAHFELDGVRKELQEARHAIQAEQDRARRQQASVAAELQQRNTELSETQKQLIAAQKDSTALEQRLEDLRGIHKQLQQECNKAQIELGRNDQALLALRGSETMARNQTQVSVAEYTALGEQLVELRSALTRRNDELRAQEQNSSALVQEVEALRRAAGPQGRATAASLMQSLNSRAAVAVQTDDDGISPLHGIRNAGSSAPALDYTPEHPAAVPSNASSIADMSSFLSPLRQMAADSKELFALCQSVHFQQLMALVADGVLTIADLHKLSTTITERPHVVGGVEGETFAIPRAASSSASTPTRQQNAATTSATLAAAAAAVEASRFTSNSQRTTSTSRRTAPEELHQLDQHFRQVVNSLYNTLKAHKLLEKFADYLRDLEMCQRHYSDALVYHRRHAEELEHDTQLIEEKLSKQISILEEKQAVQKRLVEQQQNIDNKQQRSVVATTSGTTAAGATEMREQLKLCSLLERTLEEARTEQRTTLSTLGERERQLAALQRADKLRSLQMVQLQQQLDTAQKASAQRDVVHEQMEREVESLRRRVHVLQASLRHTEHLFSNMLMKVTNSTDEFFILPSSNSASSSKYQQELSGSSTAATANQSSNSNALTLFTSTTGEQSALLPANDPTAAVFSLTSLRYAEASAQRYRGEYMRAERFRRMLALQKLYLIRLFSGVERMCCDASTRATTNDPKMFDDTADRLLLYILRALRPSAATLYPAPDSPFYPLVQRSKTLREYAVRSPLKRFKGCAMVVRAVFRMQREGKVWKSLQMKTQRMKYDAEALRDINLQHQQRRDPTADEAGDRTRREARENERKPSQRRRRDTISSASAGKTQNVFSFVSGSSANTATGSDESAVPQSSAVPFLRSRSDTNSRQKPLTLTSSSDQSSAHLAPAFSSKSTAAKAATSSSSSRSGSSRHH